MMAQKDRSLAALPPANLEDLVPTDHFYRHLERTLDLSFVREVVRDAYADIGRPSIDPVVFFKLQLVMFSEGPAPSAGSWQRFFSATADGLTTLLESSASSSPTRIRSWRGHSRSGEFTDTL